MSVKIFTFAELHNYVFHCFWLIILKSSRRGGVGRLPYQNLWNIMLIILLRGGNADFGLNFGCWDRRAVYPYRYHLGLSVKKYLWSLLLSTIEMTSTCSKLKWNHAGNWFQCKVLNIFTSFQWSALLLTIALDESAWEISLSYCKNCVGIWSPLAWATPRFVSFFIPNTPGLLSWTFSQAVLFSPPLQRNLFLIQVEIL